jgi:hypothetical protein
MVATSTRLPELTAKMRKMASNTTQIAAPSCMTRSGPQMAESVPESHEAIITARP